MKVFSFRWDIDYTYELREGVPNILELADKYGVHFTFFVNMGKAIQLKECLFQSVGISVANLMSREKIGFVRKIGKFDFIKLILTNPDVGKSDPELLKEIVNRGHELALHGGMNHALWQRKLDDYSSEELQQTLQMAYDSLDQIGIKPHGFASPGFRWNKSLLKILDSMGFAYCSDLPGTEPFYISVDGLNCRYLQIPVTISGPQGIPYIEWLYAKGTDGAEILSQTRREINARNFAVLFGHPGFEGMKTELLEQIIQFVLAQGYQILTFQHIEKLWKAKQDVAIRTV